MHILFATTNFVEDSGPTQGLPKYLLRTSLKLVEWGHKVTVVTCSNRTVNYEYYGINVYRVREYNIKRVSDEYRDEINICYRRARILHDTIAKIMEREKIDIIQYVSLNGCAYFHDFKVPAIVRLSSYAKIVHYVGQDERVKARIEMELAAAKKCDAIIGPSNVVAKEFSKDIGRKVDIIETPFVKENTEDDYTLYNCLLKEKQYLLFFGTLVEYKGIKVIAEAAYRILSSFPNLHLVIIGDGDISFINEIEQNAREYAERVIYHRAIGFGELAPIIKGAYGVILPSLMENFSNACIEAMSLKKVVIGTDGASFEQLISDGESGLLCEPGDAQSLFEAISRLMYLDEKKKKIMEENAYLRTLDLAPEKVTMQLVNYYEKVISEYNKVNNT